jgi:hypothetical protein
VPRQDIHCLELASEKRKQPEILAHHPLLLSIISSCSCCHILSHVLVASHVMTSVVLCLKSSFAMTTRPYLKQAGRLRSNNLGHQQLRIRIKFCWNRP